MVEKLAVRCRQNTEFTGPKRANLPEFAARQAPILSPVQIELVALLAAGYPAATISKRLKIAPRTYESYLNGDDYSIYLKFEQYYEGKPINTTELVARVLVGKPNQLYPLSGMFELVNQLRLNATQIQIAELLPYGFSTTEIASRTGKKPVYISELFSKRGKNIPSIYERAEAAFQTVIKNRTQLVSHLLLSGSLLYDPNQPHSLMLPPELRRAS